MSNYTVYYKSINSFFWKKLKKVKGDGMVDETAGFMTTIPGTNVGTFAQRTSNNSRWFILEDDSRIEIPSEGVMFKFSKDRHTLIRKQMSAESGQKIL